jgi:hypothetical protein
VNQNKKSESQPTQLENLPLPIKSADWQFPFKNNQFNTLQLNRAHLDFIIKDDLLDKDDEYKRQMQALVEKRIREYYEVTQLELLEIATNPVSPVYNGGLPNQWGNWPTYGEWGYRDVGECTVHATTDPPFPSLEEMKKVMDSAIPYESYDKWKQDFGLLGMFPSLNSIPVNIDTQELLKQVRIKSKEEVTKNGETTVIYTFSTLYPIEEAINDLISRKAVHANNGITIGEENWDQLFDHLHKEVDEAAIAIKTSEALLLAGAVEIIRDNILEELGDIYGILVHAAIKAGFSMKQVEDRELAKLKERYPR